MNICYSWYLAYKAPGVEFLSEHAWLSWEVVGGLFGAWGQLRAPLQVVVVERRTLLKCFTSPPYSVSTICEWQEKRSAYGRLPLTSICLSVSFTHTDTGITVHSSMWVHSLSWFLMQFVMVFKTTDVWFTFLYWRTAGCFAIFSLLFSPKAIPLLESVTNSFSQL